MASNTYNEHPFLQLYPCHSELWERLNARTPSMFIARCPSTVLSVREIDWLGNKASAAATDFRSVQDEFHWCQRYIKSATIAAVQLGSDTHRAHAPAPTFLYQPRSWPRRFYTQTFKNSSSCRVSWVSLTQQRLQDKVTRRGYCCVQKYTNAKLQMQAETKEIELTKCKTNITHKHIQWIACWRTDTRMLDTFCQTIFF